MQSYRLTHLADRALLGALTALVARDRATTAALLAHLAEVDARKLYLPAGYPSMFAYCVEALHFSEGSAYKRIRAARAARRFPALFPAVAKGRLHLSAIALLAPHLTAENFAELVAYATHRGKAEIESWLGKRFPPPLLVESAAAAPAEPAMLGQLSPGTVACVEPARAQLLATEAVPPATLEQPGPGPIATAPGLAQYLLVRLALPEATHAKLRHAQALLSHAVPAGDLAQVVDRALDALIAQLERRKVAATRKPRPRRARKPAGKRTIPAHVRRAVWRRDEGRCAFVSSDGVRCSGRWRLEFDHQDPVARGGGATVERVRLLCRAHNQLEAERVFGAAFMQAKREPGRGVGAPPAREPPG